MAVVLFRMKHLTDNLGEGHCLSVRPGQAEAYRTGFSAHLRNDGFEVSLFCSAERKPSLSAVGVGGGKEANGRLDAVHFDVDVGELLEVTRDLAL
jgi:hypothetical protein